MNNQAKIAELKKNINNKFFPEALKPKLLAQIEKLEAEDKQSQNKGILPHPKPKQSKTSIATKEGEPKFNVGDSVKIKGGFTEAIVKSYKLNRKKEFVYTCKYVNPINETFQENESGLELFNSKNISYEEMSDEDFAFTTLGKICAADGKAWNETKANSGSDIRRSDELQKGYATSMNKQMKDLGIQKNSLDEKELDYLENYNYWLLIEFLSWNNYFTSKISENKKDYYKMAWDLHHIENPNQNSSTISNPENLIISKGILPHPKPKPKSIAEAKSLHSKLKAGDTISFTVASNKPEILVGKLENRDSYGLFTVVDGKEYKLTNLLDVQLISKPKKPTVARTVKSELKKYYAHRNIKSVTVIEDGKKVVYKGEDVLNGAQFLAKGGKVEEIATYYPIRAIVEVALDNGEKVKPANGYHIKNGAKPIAELGAALATEEIINNSIVDYHNPRFAYEEGGQVDDIIIEVEQIVDIALDNKIIASNLTFNQFSEAIFDKSKISFGKSYLKLAYDSLKDVNYAKGGLTSGSGDFDYIKFLDYVQPKVAATLLENNVTLLNDYTIVHEGKEYEPVIIYKGIDGKANALSIGYFADNDPQLKLLLSIDFELEEMEYHIRSKGWNINDVDMYAKGGWVKDHKYLNKSEAYEMRYAKGKNRKGYMAKGGEVFDYKNKYSPLNITNSNDVKNFFDYLTNVEKISFHPDDKFEGNMNDSFTKKQAINLDKYMDDCFLIMGLPKNKDKDIYEIALNSQKSFAKGGQVVGRKAKGVSVKKIADMHNVTEKYLRKQLQRGQKVELEHTTDEAVAYAIAKDHIYENPDYYILLQQIEMKASGGEVKTSRFKLDDIVVPEKDGDYSEDFWKVTDLDLSNNSMTISKLKNGKFSEDFTSSPQNSEKGFRLANNEELSELNRILENHEDDSEFAKGGEVDKKGILPHPKPKREGSKIFAKAAEIREPGEKWQEAVRRANLLLKK